MTMRFHRLTLIGCALAWFLFGMHWPVVHHVMAHGAKPPAWLLALIAAMAVAGVVTLWTLLRDAGRGAG